MACGGRGNRTHLNIQSPHIGVYQSVALNETRHSILLCEPKMPVNRMDVNLAQLETTGPITSTVITSATRQPKSFTCYNIPTSYARSPAYRVWLDLCKRFKSLKGNRQFHSYNHGYSLIACAPAAFHPRRGLWFE